MAARWAVVDQDSEVLSGSARKQIHDGLVVSVRATFPAFSEKRAGGTRMERAFCLYALDSPFRLPCPPDSSLSLMLLFRKPLVIGGLYFP